MPRYNSPHYSRSRWSGWSGFSLRLVGSLVVFAVAALSGAVIGGVSIYLINDAATPPPSAGANAYPAPALSDGATTSTSPGQEAGQQASGATNGRPVRMIDPAFPPPSSIQSKTPAPAAAETATQPPAENSASSAAIQAQPATSQPPAAVQPQSLPPSAAASQPMPQDNSQATAQDAAATPDTTTHDAATMHDAATQAAAPGTGDQTDQPRKTAVARKRATNGRHPGLQPGPQQAMDQAQSTTRRDFYDYYDRDNDQPETTVRTRQDSRDPRARRGLSQPQQRIIGRRQDNHDRDARDDAADRHGFPAQPRPAQSFFGLFGGDRHYGNDRD